MVPLVPEFNSSDEDSDLSFVNQMRAYQQQSFIHQCASPTMDSHFDLRNALRAPTNPHLGSQPWPAEVMTPVMSVPVAVPTTQPLQVILVRPPPSNTGYSPSPDQVNWLQSGVQVPHPVQRSQIQANTFTISSSSSSSTMPSLNVSIPIINGTSEINREPQATAQPLLSDLPFHSRRETERLQSSQQRRTSWSGPSANMRSHLSLPLRSPSSVPNPITTSYNGELPTMSPACPSTPVLSQFPLSQSSLTYLFGSSGSTGNGPLYQVKRPTERVSGTEQQPSHNRHTSKCRAIW